MNKYISIIFLSVFKLIRIFEYISITFSKLYSLAVLSYHNAEISDPKSINFIGFVYWGIGRNVKIKIGSRFTICSGAKFGIDGTSGSRITVKDNAELVIGNHVGLTNVSIQCHESIKIGDNTIIGAGSMIVDTDFHSLNWKDRIDTTGIEQRKIKPVNIGKQVFIGSRVIILKGVTIGDNAIIGAGSVVTKDVPQDSIACGNPCCIVKC